MLQLIIKTPIEMETFNDGVLDIYTLDENESLILKLPNIRFGNRVIGAKRYFEAAQAQIEFSDLIHIPLLKQISNYDTVVINDFKYEIKQLQTIYESNPPIMVLTLKQTGIFSSEVIL